MVRLPQLLRNAIVAAQTHCSDLQCTPDPPGCVQEQQRKQQHCCEVGAQQVLLGVGVCSPCWHCCYALHCSGLLPASITLQALCKNKYRHICGAPCRVSPRFEPLTLLAPAAAWAAACNQANLRKKKPSSQNSSADEFLKSV